MPVRLQLDYDGMTETEVKDDAENLVAKHPELRGRYRVEPSETPLSWHLIFPLSAYPSFEEAYEVALESKCDKDWLEFSKTYRSFGLRTKGIVKVRRESVVAGVKSEAKNLPKEILSSPVLLDVKPDNATEVKRLAKLCSTIDDPTWEYRIEYPINELITGFNITHIVIGCQDEAQARRRINFLQGLGLKFTSKIIRKEREER